jgi:hypothetical protein
MHGTEIYLLHAIHAVLFCSCDVMLYIPISVFMAIKFMYYMWYVLYYGILLM